MEEKMITIMRAFEEKTGADFREPDMEELSEEECMEEWRDENE